MRNMVIVGTLLVVGWFWFRPFAAEPFAGDREQDLADMRTIAERVNRGLPRQVDPWTRILSVDVTDAGLVNQYELDAERQDLQVGELRLELTRQACSNRAYRRVMAEGFSVTYRYANPRGIPLATITLTEGDCPHG